VGKEEKENAYLPVTSKKRRNRQEGIIFDIFNSILSIG